MSLLWKGALPYMQQTPPWGTTVENKSNIHMHWAPSFSLLFVFFSYIVYSSSSFLFFPGWLAFLSWIQTEYVDSAWHGSASSVESVLWFQACQHRRNGEGGVPKEQAAVYFGSFCLTQLRCECMLTVPAAPRWCAFFEKWDNSFIDMEMWCSQNNSGLFYTLRQGENELHRISWCSTENEKTASG